jgi:hypothetical protein
MSSWCMTSAAMCSVSPNGLMAKGFAFGMAGNGSGAAMAVTSKNAQPVELSEDRAKLEGSGSLRPLQSI